MKDKELFYKVNDINELLKEIEKTVTRLKDAELNPISYVRYDGILDFISDLKNNVGLLNTRCFDEKDEVK